ncbi:MAG: serine/threonine protein kinase, partial [Pseudomonadota bacterium]|nr:serine/threonine protein kinase [Pseudomonadota bacterium]
MSLNKLGRYDIIRVLGKGAMGLVYEARDPNLNRRVAIKTIKVENLSEEAAAEYEARFKTEAHSAARLQHPNIVSVYDSDRHGDMAYLVMEFIQGEDLKHHLDSGKRYSLAQSLAMMRELLSALEYAHRQAIVHRDVKPANLLIEADGRVKLTDFGVARIQDSGEATRTQGSMVGTLKYMSPEQVQGQPIDARADLFAVGTVLYQLLTGMRPFDGDTDFAIIQQIVNHTQAAPSTTNPLLPAAIDAVLDRALAKKRDQRFGTAQEFAQALQDAMGQASDPTVVPPASQPGRRAGNATDTGLQRSRAGGSTVRLGSGTDTGSTVTQELELVYWKDIKDSEDIEDLAGFLERFPLGIYADLARRRLKKLGGNVAEDAASGTGTASITVAAPAEDRGE